MMDSSINMRANTNMRLHQYILVEISWLIYLNFLIEFDHNHDHNNNYNYDHNHGHD